MDLWNHHAIFEPQSTFIIHTETVDLSITFGQTSLDMCNSFINAMSCYDFPSQRRGEGHIKLSHVTRYSKVGLFPCDADSR
jgi:hypothetical protein